MPIFDDKERTLEGGANGLISAFDYLNESARSEATEVRAAIEAYFARFPEADRNSLRGRIRSKIDRQHHAAIFELLLHELLLAGGCVVEEIEPTVPGSNHRPDFLVRSADGQRFYLEAVVPSCISVEEAGAERRLEEALAAIDQVDSSDFFLSVFTDGLPSEPIAVAGLRQTVQQWVNRLNYDAVKAAWDTETALPAFEETYFGVRVRVEPIPRLRTRGALRNRAIGVRMGGVQLVEDHRSIHDAVVKKANRYGNLDLPFVVAVNAMGAFSKEDHAALALFGSEKIAINQDGDIRLGRALDGVWFGPHGPRKRSVSAVLSTERLTPWSLSQRRARFFLNPWALRSFAPAIGVDLRRVQDNRLVEEQGRSVREVLGISEDWPN